MHGFPQRNSPSLSSSKCSEVELEIIKMTNVTRDIRIVIENILDAKDLQKRVDSHLIHSFAKELSSISDNLRFFPSDRDEGYKVSHKITECREEDEHSEKTGNGLKGSHFNLQSSHLTKDDGRESVDLGELLEANQELTEENEFLSQKLEEAESYIKKIQQQNSILMVEISSLRNEQKTNVKVSKAEHLDEKDGLYLTLINENEELRAQLQETKDFIIRNNEDFVRELQKYNEKIWKLDRELEQVRTKLALGQAKAEEGDLLITRLREENFQLQVLARNMKNLIGQQERKDSGLRDYSQGQDSDRLRPQTNRLKDFFRDRIQETLRRKQTD